MIPRVVLTIGSTMFLILLIVSYYSKKFKTKLNNIIYADLLLISLGLLVTEIIYVVCFEFVRPLIFYNIFVKIHWLNASFVLYFIYYYVCAVANNFEYKSVFEMVKNYKICKITTIIGILFGIAFIFLPLKELTIETFDFIPGTGAYVLVANYAILIFMCFYEIRKNKIERNVKNAVLFSGLLALAVLAFQAFIPGYSFLCLLDAVVLFIFYSLTENPDLRLIEDIDELKQSVERKKKKKSDFLSNMSHEIRSPMNAIIGFSETILEEKDFNSAKTLQDINHIRSSSKNLLDIIDNILDISKIETGTDTIENKEYSLSELLVDWTGIVNTRLEGKSIKFIIDIDKNLPSKYYGDATKMFQIVLNLLTNAVKYTEVGRIKLTITGERLGTDLLKLKFKVADTGFGIKKEDYDKVFEKFQRLDSAKTNEIEGTGLGLVLTKRYAELMGGNIWFESEYRAGSTFYFEVPQKVTDEKAIGNIEDNIQEDGKKQLLDCTGLKVLVVDDDALNLKVIKRLLGGYKLTVDTLEDPEECIFKIKSGEHYDLIFLDHIMHGMSGVELLKVLKGLQGYSIPPVIMLTANAINGVREMYLKEGFDEYLSKPVSVNELDKVINVFLRKQ